VEEAGEEADEAAAAEEAVEAVDAVEAVEAAEAAEAAEVTAEVAAEVAEVAEANGSRGGGGERGDESGAVAVEWRGRRALIDHNVSDPSSDPVTSLSSSKDRHLNGNAVKGERGGAGGVVRILVLNCIALSLFLLQAPLSSILSSLPLSPSYLSSLLSTLLISPLLVSSLLLRDCPSVAAKGRHDRLARFPAPRQHMLLPKPSLPVTKTELVAIPAATAVLEGTPTA
jgi:hypothetical protein